MRFYTHFERVITTYFNLVCPFKSTTQNPLVATPCGFKSHHRHQPLKPLVSLFFGEQAVFLLRVQKTGLAFRLLFFVCHFAKWPKSPAAWLGFSHTAPSFLLFPTKLCCANFRGSPALRAEEKSGYPFYHANSASKTAWESHSRAVLFLQQHTL